LKQFLYLSSRQSLYATKKQRWRKPASTLAIFLRRPDAKMWHLFLHGLWWQPEQFFVPGSLWTNLSRWLYKIKVKKFTWNLGCSFWKSLPSWRTIPHRTRSTFDLWCIKNLSKQLLLPVWFQFWLVILLSDWKLDVSNSPFQKISGTK